MPRGRPKGSAKLGGRKKGTPNKLNATVREMILHALDKCGGEKYLVEQAKENPVAFMSLLGRILPTQMDVTSSDGSLKPIKIVLEGVRAGESADS